MHEQRSWIVPGQSGNCAGMRTSAHWLAMDTAAPISSPDSPLPLKVQLLGRFAVSIGAAEVPASEWPSLRAQQLVQLLSLQPRHCMHRDRVIEALWPQLDSQAGAANLRKALHHARQALGRHEAIVAQGGELMLWPDRPVIVDSNEFLRMAAAALERPNAVECARLARAYTGDLLPGAQYEDWTETARERLRASRHELLRAGAQWDELARLEPTDEPAHRALMKRELDAGNRAAALRWYAHLREALQHSLAVLPDRQTEALYERCLAGLQTTGPAFVGRALELAQLTAWLEAMNDDRPGCIIVSGPGGIGKTALCREIGVQSRDRGWSMLRIGATHNARAYAVVSAIIERLLLADHGLIDRIGSGARNILALFSPLAAPADDLPGPLGRHQVLGALRRLLVASSAGGDLLLHVDDAHLADDADIDVLLQLAVSGAPVCLLLSTRPLLPGSKLVKGVARLQRAEVLKRLDLAPLDEDECRRLVLRVAGKALPDGVIPRLLRAADGNPFAAIELARCVAASGHGRLPAATSDAVLERLCDVPDHALEILRWLALCSDRFDVATIEAFVDGEHTAPIAAIDACMAAGVLVPSGSQFQFRHELVRQALIDQIPRHRLAAMHRRIAGLLVERAAEPAAIARHWLEAGKPRDAVPWLLAAARDAMRLAAFGDALHHLEPLLACEPGHAEALRLRAESLDAMGQPAALAAYHLAAEAAGAPQSHDLLAKAALAQVKQGDPEGGLALLERLQPVSLEGRLCEALAYSGAAALGFADPAIGTAKAAVARKLALQTGDTASIVVASWAQAAAAHARGELHQSVWADLHETIHVPQLAVRVFDGHLCITQRFLYGARPYREVIAFASALATEANRLGAARGRAFGTTLRGEAEWLSGNLAAARRDLAEGARLHHAIGGHVGHALSLQRLAELSLHEGRRDEARSLIDEALDLARQTDIGFHLLDRIFGTRVRMRAEDPSAALCVIQDAMESVRGPLETCPGCRITFAVPAAIGAARAGEVELAETFETQCAYLANVVMRLPAWYAAHDEVRGHIAAARRAPTDEVVAHFAAAFARYRAAGHRVDASRCERVAGQIASGGNGASKAAARRRTGQASGDTAMPRQRAN